MTPLGYKHKLKVLLGSRLGTPSRRQEVVTVKKLSLIDGGHMVFVGGMLVVGIRRASLISLCSILSLLIYY